MSNYQFRGYCDICNDAGPWFGSEDLATSWRELHFEKYHSDNPMKATNCRIQRRNKK